MLKGKIWSLPQPPLHIVLQTAWAGSRGVQHLSIDGLLLSLDYLRRKGSCQPSAHYIWGFSSILLFIYCISSVIFAAILAFLHYESRWSGKIARARYELNTYRDAVDLVYDLQDNYFGDALRSMSAEVLKKQCANKSISMDTCELPLSRKEERRLYRSTLDTAASGRPGGIAREIRFWMLASIEFIKTLVLRPKSRDKIRIKLSGPSAPTESLKAEENDYDYECERPG